MCWAGGRVRDLESETRRGQGSLSSGPSKAFGCSLCCVDSFLPTHPTSPSRAPPSLSINGLKRAFYSAHRPPNQYLHSQDAPRPAGLGCCCTAPCRQDGRLPMARAG